MLEVLQPTSLFRQGDGVRALSLCVVGFYVFTSQTFLTKKEEK